METGSRISEALALTPGRVDTSTGAVVFETLKKRRRGVFRSVPISPALKLMVSDLIAQGLEHVCKVQYRVGASST